MNSGRGARGSVALLVVRPVLTVATLVAVYYLLPVDRPVDGWTVVGLVAGVGLVVGLVVGEIRAILRAKYPALQGVQALALIVPLFLLVFANAYYVLQHNVPQSFDAPLTRTDALYFVVTVFATVGFGDIVAVTQTARVLVTVQMLGDLLVIGVALRVIVVAVQHSRQRPGAESVHLLPRDQQRGDDAGERPAGEQDHGDGERSVARDGRAGEDGADQRGAP
ncbi:potassium channel family protein [Amycolatopsis sp. NPDC051903]|uniref:potassium channel family protein n=1 Tax=Amycolatopsis sp. NPDC051903 TaxID=3363936 RepID=UPI0037B219E6